MSGFGGFVSFGGLVKTGLAVFGNLFFVAEGEFNRCAGKIEIIAHNTVEVAFITPVQELEIGAIHYKPRRIVVGLDHVAKFWVSVFEAGWWVLEFSVGQDLVESTSWNGLLAVFHDVQRQIEEFSDVFTGDA